MSYLSAMPASHLYILIHAYMSTCCMYIGSSGCRTEGQGRAGEGVAERPARLGRGEGDNVAIRGLIF